jgi:hypothetical protein
VFEWCETYRDLRGIIASGLASDHCGRTKGSLDLLTDLKKLKQFRRLKLFAREWRGDQVKPLRAEFPARMLFRALGISYIRQR